MTVSACAVARGASSPAETSIAVEWRGAPLSLILADLSTKLSTPYLVDPSVPEGAMDRRIRFMAAHLSGAQAFRWAARLAGLEAAVRGDIVLIGPPEILPKAWRIAALPTPADEERFRAAESRQAAITWIDAPLSSVARDISTQFGIDVAFHADITAEQGLVQLEQSQATLESIRRAIETQLNARTSFFDGLLWVRPAAVPDPLPATRPAYEAAPNPAETRGSAAADPLDCMLLLDRSIRDWPALCEAVSRSAGAPCRWAGGAQPFGSPLEARGSVGAVLDAAQLLGRLTWRTRSGSAPTSLTIEISPGRPGR